MTKKINKRIIGIVVGVIILLVIGGVMLYNYISDEDRPTRHKFIDTFPEDAVQSDNIKIEVIRCDKDGNPI